jgi:hypothetical protein
MPRALEQRVMDSDAELDSCSAVMCESIKHGLFHLSKSLNREVGMIIFFVFFTQRCHL